MAEQQKSFADYVKDLMNILPTVNSNPMLSVTSQTDVDKYRENPFYMQDAIRKRNAEEEAAKKGNVTGGGGGLFGSMPSTGGDSANQENQRNYYQEIEDRFYNENLTMGLTPETARTLAAQQAFDIQSANNLNINNFLTDMSKVGIGGLLTQIAGSSLFGNKLLDTRAPIDVSRTTRSPAAIQESIARAQAISQAQANAEAQAKAQAAAAAAAAAAAPSAYNAYTGSASSGDWSWFDNASRSYQDSVISDLSRSDAAGNAAAASMGISANEI